MFVSKGGFACWESRVDKSAGNEFEVIKLVITSKCTAKQTKSGSKVLIFFSLLSFYAQHPTSRPTCLCGFRISYYILSMWEEVD